MLPHPFHQLFSGLNLPLQCLVGSSFGAVFLFDFFYHLLVDLMETLVCLSDNSVSGSQSAAGASLQLS